MKAKDEEILIHAFVLSRGPKSLVMEAEPFNKKGKLVAKGTSQNLILDMPPEEN